MQKQVLGFPTSFVPVEQHCHGAKLQPCWVCTASIKDGVFQPLRACRKTWACQPISAKGLANPFLQTPGLRSVVLELELVLLQGIQKIQPSTISGVVEVAQAAAYKAPVAVVQILVLRAMTRISRGFPALPKSGVLAGGFCCSCPEERCHLFNIFKGLPIHESTRLSNPYSSIEACLRSLRGQLRSDASPALRKH